MSFETLVTQDVKASVGLIRAAADQTQDFLRWLVSQKSDHRFSIGKREFKIAANGGSRIKERDDGGCDGQIVTEAADGPIPLKFTLAWSDGGSARLTLAFNPSRMLAAADVAPTLSRSRKPAPKFPASSIEVNGTLLGLGFDVLAGLYAEERGGRGLFEVGGKKFTDGDIRVERVQWDLLLPTRDPQRFLQPLPLIFEPVFKGDDGKVVKLGELLRLKPTHDPDPHTGEMRSVTLTRIQGERRKVNSAVFSLGRVGRKSRRRAKRRQAKSPACTAASGSASPLIPKGSLN